MTFVARPTLGVSHGVDNLASAVTASYAKHGGAGAGKDSRPHNIVARPLRANRWGGADSHGDEGNIVASAVLASAGHHGHSSPRGDGADNLVAGTVSAKWAKWAKGSGGPSGDEVQNMVALNGVRRLTPRECERLQGWRDDHTRYTADEAEISDSHRYRQIGNGVASPVVEWIGRRLVAVDAMLQAEAA